jgi:hypothetical protein
MAATFDRLSSQVWYASRCGVVADGSTDNTATVQAVLDRYGQAGTPLEFIFDQAGTALFAGTLHVYSNQTIRGVAGACIKKAGFQASNGYPLITNKHWAPYGTAITEQQITIRDLNIDGNRRGGACGVQDSGTPGQTASGYVCTTLDLIGVNFFHVENVHVFDAPTFGLHLTNATNGTVVNFTKFLNPGDTVLGDSVVQMQGGCQNVHCYGLGGTTNDDPWAINPSDAQDLTGSTPQFYPGSIADGPCSNISIRDSYFQPGSSSSGHFGRLTSKDSTTSCTNILISNCTATANDLAIWMQPVATSGIGVYDDITFENCTCYFGNSGCKGIYMQSCGIGRMTIQNFRLVPTTTINGSSPFYGGTPAIIYGDGNTTIGSLLVDGLHVDDSNSYLALPVFQFDGIVDHLEVRGTRYNHGTSLATVPFAKLNGSVNRVQFVGGRYDRVPNVALVSGGTTNVIIATGVSHTNAGGGKSFTTGGGTLTALIQGVNDTASVGP